MKVGLGTSLRIWPTVIGREMESKTWNRRTVQRLFVLDYLKSKFLALFLFNLAGFSLKNLLLNYQSYIIKFSVFLMDGLVFFPSPSPFIYFSVEVWLMSYAGLLNRIWPSNISRKFKHVARGGWSWFLIASSKNKCSQRGWDKC